MRTISNLTYVVCLLTYLLVRSFVCSLASLLYSIPSDLVVFAFHFFPAFHCINKFLIIFIFLSRPILNLSILCIRMVTVIIVNGFRFVFFITFFVRELFLFYFLVLVFSPFHLHIIFCVCIFFSLFSLMLKWMCTPPILLVTSDGSCSYSSLQLTTLKHTIFFNSFLHSSLSSYIFIFFPLLLFIFFLLLQLLNSFSRSYSLHHLCTVACM